LKNPGRRGFHLNEEFTMANEELFKTRLKRVQDAVDLKEPDQMPMALMVNGAPYYLYNKGSHKAEMYNYEECEEPYIRYHEEFKPDIGAGPVFQSGKANEIAETTIFDWPGRPGSIVSDASTYQVFEREYMHQDEYDEFLNDYWGFIFKKHIPRAFPGLRGLQGLTAYNPVSLLGMRAFSAMFTPALIEALDKFKQIYEESLKPLPVAARINRRLADMGFPPYYTAVAEAPFDAISDYLRGTAAMFDDQIECPDKIAAACDLLADIQIANLQYFRTAPLPVKRVFFPLHKGMDGFMSPQQYEELYWKPMDKIFTALIDMGVTPYIYTEGKYNTRYKFIAEQLRECHAPGTCIVHFEEGDFAEFKKTFSGIAAITGGMPLQLLQWGTREEVVNRVKYLVDNCAAGGGYLFNTGASMEDVKYENVEAMFETARSYGKK
jgi:uroporphyrinogen-III decarboxylase